MESKMKGGMGMMMCFMLVVLMGVSSPLYAADVEVDKEEFDQAWKEAYESLPEEAREEFYKLTIDAFKEGEVGYVKDEVPVAEEGRSTREGPRGREERGGVREDLRIGTPPPDTRMGPRIGGQTYGAGRTDDSYGPRMEGSTLQEMGYSEEDISKIRQAEDEVGKLAGDIDWSSLTREEAMAKELELQKQFQEISGHDATEVFMMGGPRPVDMPYSGEGPVIFTDRPLGFEPPGYRPPVGVVWDGEGPMPIGPGPIGGEYTPVQREIDGILMDVDPFTGQIQGPALDHETGEFIDPEAAASFFESGGPAAGPYFDGPGPVGIGGGPMEGPYFDGPGPMMEGPYFGPEPPKGFEGPYMEGPYFEGPMMEGPHFGPMEGPYFEGPAPVGPGFEGPMMEGPYMEGPHFEGPMMEGPAFEGPAFEGPAFEGPVFEGPMMEGPEFEAPMFEGPEFEAPEFVPPEFEPEFIGKEEPEPYYE